VALNSRSLYGRDREEIRALVSRAKFPAFRGDQLLGWLYDKPIGTFEEAANLPADLRAYLTENFELAALVLQEIFGTDPAESRKFLFKTQDLHFVESVLIPQKDRRTVCVSTQLGCKMGCVFCASGKARFVRNLTAGEIVEQIVWTQKETGEKATNVVFMGMGEPLDNFEPVMKALKILQASWGFGLGARRITVSTVGIVPKIREFVERSEGRVRLSVSLHAPEEKKRAALVPLSRKYPLKDLTAALRQIHRRLKREITFEYTLIEGYNDSSADAKAVADLARPLGAKVNLIAYNPIREVSFRSPSAQGLENFRTALESGGVRVTLRQSAGRNIEAACGQLRLDRETIQG
jgi:23S rRNA (adenine2503-C2)-methyltransferase